MQVFGEWAQVEAVELVNDGSGLAFGIVGGRSSGVVIKSVLPGGVADRDGRLRSGDMLLRIGAVCVVGMCARQAAAVLRQCGACVRLLVARPAAAPVSQSLGASPAPIIPSRFLADPIELERRLAEAGHEGFGVLCEDTTPTSPQHVIDEKLHQRGVASMVAVVPLGALAPSPRPPQPVLPPPVDPKPPPLRLPLDMAVRGNEPETVSYEIELKKDSSLGLGITVAGYVCEQEELSGIFVKSISTGSSADVCGKIQVNDRIVEVDGVSLHGVTNHRAVGLLRDAKGPVVTLKSLRYLRGAGYEKLQRALAAQDGRPPASPIAPPSPSVTSLAKYSFSVYDESTVIEAEPESEARHHPPSPTSPYEDAEIVIGRENETSESDIRRIQDKWRDILDSETDWPGHQHQFDIIVGTIIKNKDSGLGISLEGTVRVVGGKEVQARHYIRAIAPNGPVHALGIYHVGDELLEVNGWRVLGAHHVEVVTKLRAVTSPVQLVCARKRDDECLSKSETSLVRSILDGSLQELLTLPQRLIKAKSESSLTSLYSASSAMTSHYHDEFCTDDLDRNRSRSLEPLSCLAMWSDHVQVIQLQKREGGLGFSILDYLDPTEPGSSVIVVRAVMSGGAAATDGRLSPGDRLMSVNGLDVSRGSLSQAVCAIKAAPKGLVTIGVAKPLPCSTIIGGERANGHSAHDSEDQEFGNSCASDDHTTGTAMDSFHECLQEYGEGLEVVQICLEPEDDIKDDDISVFADLSYDDCQKIDDVNILGLLDDEKTNGLQKTDSHDSIEHDDDMTTTDDILASPRELPDRSKSADIDKNQAPTKLQSKDYSTSDEMVFAVTPTGLERISFDSYWKKDDSKKFELDLNINSDVDLENSLKEVKSDESWKECINSPTDYKYSSYETMKGKGRDSKENSVLLFIDHEVDGYVTCADETSYEKNAIKKEHKTDMKDKRKHDKITVPNSKKETVTSLDSDDVSYSYRPYVQEHIIKQMKSLRIEPINVNISKKRRKSPTKHKERKCIEYYNDTDECLEEIRQKKLEDNRRKEQRRLEKAKRKLKKQKPSEDSIDLSECHKCFLEDYAYALTELMIGKCKYCEVIREMLEPISVSGRRGSAPALVNLESTGSESDDDNLLFVPVERGRRRSAGPLKFIVPSRRPSFSPLPAMTVTVSPNRRDTSLQRWGPPRKVVLTRSSGAPLGVSIVGGKVDIVSTEDSEDGEEKAIFGIFIKNVVPNSPAGASGDLKTGDRILEVDGVCVRSAQHERAVQLIKAAGNQVTLTVQSLMTWHTDSSEVEPASPSATPVHHARKGPAPEKPSTPKHEIKITVTSEPDSDKGTEDRESEKEAVSTPEKHKQVYSDSESSDEEDERDLQGRTYTENGVEIDRASAGAIKRSRDEKEADPEEEDDFGYTTNKIRKKYASLGDTVVTVKLERSSKAGLGLSLAGHRDRSRMAVFVCGLNPAGSAAKASPSVNVGDEILEVNGVVLHGRCHLNASAIIKGLVGPVFKIILLRRKTALEDVAVKPLTQFPVEIEEDSEDRFAGYKGVRDITVKKGASGLGIMIIEGRHTEAGRGIFVSDLQEGSAAEHAGLQIGDMILAVNRDSLLSCTYDAAAAKLKHTEGVVVLTVCSPNMKDEKTDDGGSGPTANGAPGTDLKPGASRPTTPRPTPSPVKVEPPADPSVAPIVPNKDTVIEINSNSEMLGIVLLGGSDTLINGAAAVILDIYKNGAVAKDGRLKAGDQILDCNGIQIKKEMAHERVCLSIKQKAAKLRMTVHRPEPIKYEEIEVDLNRKAGKVLGLSCVAPAEGTGVYLGDLLPGSPAEMDGRIQRGDYLLAVDGKDMTAMDYVGAAAVLKLCGNKAVIKVRRFKLVK